MFHTSANIQTPITALRTTSSSSTLRKSQSEQVAKAEAQCRAAQLKPRNDELNLKGPSFCLGLLLQSQGDFEGALKSYSLAIERNHVNTPAHLNVGLILSDLDRVEDAMEHFRRAVNIIFTITEHNNSKFFESKDDFALISTASAASLNKLIPFLIRNGNVTEGLTICQRLINMQGIIPSNLLIAAHDQLGNAYHKQGNLQKAFLSFEKVIEMLLIEESDTKNQYGGERNMTKDEEFDENKRKLVIALNKAFIAAQKVNDNDKAEEYIQKSLQVDASFADRYTHLGCYRKDQGRINDAIAAFKQAISLERNANFRGSEVGYASVQLASLTGGSNDVKTMSTSYIKGLFDGYSNRFENELVDKLEYVGHELVVDAIKKSILPQSIPNKELFICDLGCGSGLCGPLIRNLIEKKNGKGNSIARLVGVDLSGCMLRQAAEKKCYTDLREGEMVTYLNSLSNKPCIDILLAADVLIYIGDLLPLFTAIKATLVPQTGLFAFTIEELMSVPLDFRGDGISSNKRLTANDEEDIIASDTPESTSKNDRDDDTDDGRDDGRDDIGEKDNNYKMCLLHGVRLLDVGRFGHTDEYIRFLATRIGFNVISAKKCVLRIQRGKPVHGITYLLSC